MPTPITVMMTEPTIAFLRPPSVEPGGGVFSVKICTLIPARPLYNSVKRMKASQVTPKMGGQRQSSLTITSLRRRWVSIGFMFSIPRLFFQSHQHQPRHRQHEEGQHEQQ